MNKISITEIFNIKILKLWKITFLKKFPYFLLFQKKKLKCDFFVCRYNQLLKQKVQLEELEKVLKIEQEKMLQQNEKHETVAAEYKKLRDENER